MFHCNEQRDTFDVEGWADWPSWIIDDLLKTDRPQGAKEQAENPLGRRRKCENADGLVKEADWIILNCYFGLTLPSGKEGINVCLLPFLSHFSGPKNGNQANVSCVQSLFWFTNLFTFHVRKSSCSSRKTGWEARFLGTCAFFSSRVLCYTK